MATAESINARLAATLAPYEAQRAAAKQQYESQKKLLGDQLAAQNLAELLRANKDHPLIALTGAVSDGGVDIDKLYNALAPRFTEKMDVDIPMIERLSFSCGDLDKLYNEMRV